MIKSVIENYSVNEVTNIFSSYDICRLNTYRSREEKLSRIYIKQFGDTYCTLFTDVGYFNYVHNFNEDSLLYFDEIVEFYKKHNLDFKVLVPDLKEFQKVNNWIKKRGKLIERRGILSVKMDNLIIYQEEKTIHQMCWVDKNNIHDFINTYLLAFRGNITNFEEVFANMKLLLKVPDINLYLIKENNVYVGVGVLYIQNDIAFLAGGATIESYRENGAHMFSLNFRIQKAKQLGAKIVSSWAPQNETSFNNMKTVGLEHLFTTNVYQIIT
ncbi:hypothetical protein ACFLS9_01530 [Bacteroidota bacterium]